MVLGTTIMKICKQYRIVTDKYNGYEVQRRNLIFPFWIQIRKGKLDTNSQSTIEECEKLIDRDKKGLNKWKRRVIKVYSCA